MKKAIIVMFLLTTPAWAFAAGGFFSNFQGSQFSFSPDMETTSVNSNYRMFGGFGYGVSDSGWVSGGFGAAITGDENTEIDIVGGMGGSVGGYQFTHRPIHLAIMTYTALGGMRVEKAGFSETYFIGSFEADIEVGLPLTSWFTPVFFAGYRATGNISPGDMFETFVSYGPVTGIRFSFGP